MGNRLRLPITVSCLVNSLQVDEAMTKELSQVLAADAVRRLSQEEELNLKPERLLRMLWVLSWKYTEGGDRKAKSAIGRFGIAAPRTYKCTDSSLNTWNDVSSFVTASMRSTQTSGTFW